MEYSVRTIADKSRIENEMSWEDRDVPKTLFGLLNRAGQNFPNRSAVSFQLLSDPKSPAVTLNWKEFRSRSVQAANLFHSLGIGEKDVVGYLLPNSIETATVLVGGAIAGIVSPINPLLDVTQIAGILRDINAKVLVTLKSFPKTDIAQKAAAAAAMAPSVETILEVDLNRYLSFPKSWIVLLLRPKNSIRHAARVLDFNVEQEKQRDDDLDFDSADEDRFAACFHTGGTTGMPKIAQHKYSGIIFNGWCGAGSVANQGRRHHLPASAISRFCRLSHTRGGDGVGRAFCHADPGRIQGGRSIRQFLEARRTLEGFLHRDCFQRLRRLSCKDLSMQTYLP